MTHWSALYHFLSFIQGLKWMAKAVSVVTEEWGSKNYQNDFWKEMLSEMEGGCCKISLLAVR